MYVPLVLAILGVLVGVTATVLGTLSYVNYLSFTLPTPITVTLSNHVGINDPAPLCSLSVGGGSLADPNVPIQISAHGSQSYLGVNREDGKYGLLTGYDINSGGCVIRSVNANDSILFQVSNTNHALTILSNGNVGLGSIAPAYPLDVSNTSRFQQNTITNGLVTQSELVTSSGPLSTSLDSLIDSRVASLIVTLGNGVNDQVKTVRLLYRNAFPVTVSCVSGGGGSFLLTPSDPCRVLRFTNNTWITDVASTASGITSFYPSTQQGSKLVGTASSGPGCQQGGAVALSADGNTMAVGGRQDTANQGAVWIFVRTGSTWSQHGNKIPYPGNSTGNVYFGSSVSLSADGNTLAIGSPEDNSGVGSVWVFVQTGSTWNKQGGPLVGTGAIGSANQGIVALSADGNTLVVGGPADSTSAGAIWIFIRSNGNWSQQTKLTGTGSMGQSVAISADGNTVAAGGPTDSTNLGAVWVFVRDISTSSWASQAKLVGGGYSGASAQGNSVCLSADGHLLAVGGVNDNTGYGSVWLWSRSYGSWSQQGSKISVSGSIAFGLTVAFSADGHTLAVSTTSPSMFACIFVRSGYNMTLKTILTASDSSMSTSSATSVALCASGNTLAVGNTVDSSNLGASWAFI